MQHLALFAIHQFIEGFVWLGLDGMLLSQVTHYMGGKAAWLMATTLPDGSLQPNFMIRLDLGTGSMPNGVSDLQLP
jgi:hypothetical protein